MNVLVNLRGTVDVPETILVSLIGPAEDTDAWYERATYAAEQKCEDDTSWALNHLTGGDLEFDAS